MRFCFDFDDADDDVVAVAPPVDCVVGVLLLSELRG